MFMNWIKGVLMHKGIAHIMEAAFKNVLPETENASRQMVEQKQGVKDNPIGMGIVTLNVTCPSLIVKIKIR